MKNMKKLLKIRFIIPAILIAVVVVMIPVIVISNRGGGESVDKETVIVDALRPALSFEGVCRDATTIVYGKVVGVGETKVHESTGSAGSILKEYYKEITIEVIDLIKGAAKDNKVTYLQMGGETDTHIYIYEEYPPVSISDEVILFLSDRGVCLGPQACIYVKDGMVSLDHKVIPETYDAVKKATTAEELVEEISVQVKNER